MSSATTPLLADTWGMHGDVGWGWMSVMMFGMVLFWGAVIVGVVWLIRNAGATAAPAGSAAAAGRETPVEILERRFAEGAISADEYQARRQVLTNGAAGLHRAPGDEPLAVPRSEGASRS